MENDKMDLEKERDKLILEIKLSNFEKEKEERDKIINDLKI
jgi:hypothetical protein